MSLFALRKQVNNKRERCRLETEDVVSHKGE